MVCVENPWASGRNVVSPYIAFTLYNVLVRWCSFVRVVIRLVCGVSHVEAILAYLLYSSFCSHTEIPLLISWEQRSMEENVRRHIMPHLPDPHRSFDCQKLSHSLFYSIKTQAILTNHSPCDFGAVHLLLGLHPVNSLIRSILPQNHCNGQFLCIHRLRYWSADSFYAEARISISAVIASCW